ncbi:hypothetical protein [Providencia phage PSTRCR_128]|nr:hypothetical protein [Providencia phage PSTRCR_128]
MHIESLYIKLLLKVTYLKVLLRGRPFMYGGINIIITT